MGKLKQKREKEVIREKPIILTSEFSGLLHGFQSMSTDTRIYGLGGLSTVDYKNCPICFNQIKSKKQGSYFKCKRHLAHKKCAKNYYRSNYNKDYLCPMRCAAVAQ